MCVCLCAFAIPLMCAASCSADVSINNTHHLIFPVLACFLNYPSNGIFLFLSLFPSLIFRLSPPMCSLLFVVFACFSSQPLVVPYRVSRCQALHTCAITGVIVCLSFWSFFFSILHAFSLRCLCLHLYFFSFMFSCAYMFKLLSLPALLPRGHFFDFISFFPGASFLWLTVLSLSAPVAV